MYNMNSKVEPIKECQICFELYSEKNISDLKCWAENKDDHIICQFCFETESNIRKKKGVQYPNECILCKPYQEKIEQIIINPSPNITITIENTRSYNNSETYLQFWIRIIKSAIVLASLYIGFCLNWHLFLTINHLLQTGNLFDESISWHPFNVFYAICMDWIIFLILFGISSECHKKVLTLI